MHKPLFHVIKKERPLKEVIILRGIAFVLSLLVCALFIFAITKLNPIDVYGEMIKATFSSSRRLMNTLRDAIFLWIISIGLAPAFKMKFWNIGAEGQILIGGVITAAMMINFGGKIPTLLLLVISFILSFIAGGIWGFIPAYFKVKYRTNETLFTLMMNYVAIQITEFMVDVWDKKQSHSVGVINQATKDGWFPEIFGQQYALNIILVLIFAIAIHIYINNSKHGYELTVVGDSEPTARYAGINVKKVIIRTVVLSAGICAIAGFMQVAGVSHSISTATSGGKGFTAIIVCFLSKYSPFVMSIVSFLLAFLSKGATQISSKFNFNEYSSDIIIGIILFFIVGSEFFINYKIVFNKKGENK